MNGVGVDDWSKLKSGKRITILIYDERKYVNKLIDFQNCSWISVSAYCFYPCFTSEKFWLSCKMYNFGGCDNLIFKKQT